MTGRPRRHPLAMVPAFVVGLSSAVAAEVAIGILLYAGPGFVRSLTILLTVEAGALAAGLWIPYPTLEPADGLRRRWLFTMSAFLAATVFGTVWTVMPEIGTGNLGQGLGLAMLAGLPLYACGALFAGLAHEAAAVDGRVRPHVAAGGALGAAAGFAMTGYLLPRAPTPSSLLVGCLVFLSLGGMAYNVTRMAWGRRRVVAQGCLGPPPVRVEERVAPGDDEVEWLLLEGDVVRAVRRADDALPVASGLAWDVELTAAFAPSGPEPWRALYVGGGASSAPAEALRRNPAAEVIVLERAHCVVELGRSHFATDGAAVGAAGATDAAGAAGAGAVAGERVRVLTGNVEDHLRSLEGDFDLIVVDGRALDAVGGLSALSADGRRVLKGLLAPDGVMAWGPKAAHHPRDFDDADWETHRRDPAGSLDEVWVVRRAPDASASHAPPAGGTAIP